MKINEICQKYDIENYTINEDGSIDVDGDVDLYKCELTELPLNFNKVNGDFDCSYNFLTTLKGSPKYVSGEFGCNHNDLTSLEYSPEYVGDDFDCRENKIRDLYGISDNIDGKLYILDNPIDSILDIMDMDFIRAFNVYKVIKDDKVQLKRLKYVMELFNMYIDLPRIKSSYRIIQ